jgi:hypothetical protein
MRKETKIVFSVLGSMVLAATTFALPATPNHSAKQPIQEQTTPSQSVSGKITSVMKSSFTLALAGGTNGEQMGQTAPKMMTFQIDKNTAVDGKLKVGSDADVTYREDGANYIAVSVHVSE